MGRGGNRSAIKRFCTTKAEVSSVAQQKVPACFSCHFRKPVENAAKLFITADIFEPAIEGNGFDQLKIVAVSA